MRDAFKSLGGDPNMINPLCPADLVIDHSVQVDFSRVYVYGIASNATTLNKQSKQRLPKSNHNCSFNLNFFLIWYYQSILIPWLILPCL